MNLKILTEEQAKDLAIETSVAAFELFISKYNSEFKIPKDPEKDQLLTVKQLAEYWQCHPQTIFKKKKKGELPFFQHGRKLFFKKSEIDLLSANPI